MSSSADPDVVVVASTPPPPLPDTASDAAIAAALAEESRCGAAAVKAADDDDDPTRDDAALAWALQEAETASSTAPSRVDAASLTRAASEGPPPPWRAVLERVAAARVADAPVRPHVPRLSSFFSGDAAVEHARLSATLAAYGLAEWRVCGDGACQYRSLSHQLYGREDYHPAVRAAVVAQLASRPDLYSGFVVGGGATAEEEDYRAYVNRMARPTEWGDHVTLQAAADALRSRIVVISTYAPNPIINVEPSEGLGGGGDGKHVRTLFVSFWAEVHFNSVLPAGVGGDAGRPAGGRPASTPERIRRWFAANF